MESIKIKLNYDKLNLFIYTFIWLKDTMCDKKKLYIRKSKMCNHLISITSLDFIIAYTHNDINKITLK